MKSIKLCNNIRLPIIGYGTWKLKNGDTTKKILTSAISKGYKLIDTAEHYENEETLGEVIAESNIKRDNLFITSKLWVESREYDKVFISFNKTLKKLKLEYLDLYLIHWPASKTKFDNYREINYTTWSAFEKLYESGKVKAIGVCNFTVQYLEELIKDCKIKPMVNQIEFHPGFMQNDIVNFCFENDICVQAWSPLGHGEILNNNLFKMLSNKYKKTPAQIIIKWVIQHNIIPIPKTIDEKHMLENIEVFDFEITQNDMKLIDELKYCGGLALNPDKFD